MKVTMVFGFNFFPHIEARLVGDAKRASPKAQLKENKRFEVW
jgi:hypothetical protein